jgi:polyhydroxybutyrate depolymerase
MRTASIRLVVLLVAAIAGSFGCTRSNPEAMGAHDDGGGAGGVGGVGPGEADLALRDLPGTPPADGGGGTDGPPATADLGGGPPPPPVTCSGKPAQPRDSTWTLHVGGVDRKVQAHVPAGYDATKPTPLVLNFHGYTSNGAQQAALSGMSTRADSHVFVVLYPEGTGNPTSFNGGGCCGSAATNKVDDIGFTRALITEAKTRLCVDDKRVFVAGMSNGGFMAQRIGCELADVVAAISAVSAPLAVASCAPARPMPVLSFHGTSDMTVSYNGDAQSGWPSAMASFSGWAMRDGCRDAMPAQTYKKGDVTCLTYSQCNAGAAVTLCTVQGGGHAWPGSAIPLPGTTQNINATDTMWTFFEAHPLP